MKHIGNTLVDLFKNHSNNSSNYLTFILGRQEEHCISYMDVYKNALIYLFNLQEKGLKQGDMLVFQIKDIRKFVYTFWACIMGGIIAVPLTVTVNDEHFKKFLGVWSKLNNRFIITDNKNIKREISKRKNITELTSKIEEIENKLLHIDVFEFQKESNKPYDANPEDIAFIQFSSGSTGDPKGIILSHSNIITNIKAIAKGSNLSNDDRSLSWLPITHDMGLIGFHITPIIVGFDQCLMDQALFIRHPQMWMEKINQHRISLTASPNFGFYYFLKNMKEEKTMNWDLSCVRLIFNGAEPIDDSVCKKFLEKLHPYKLKKNSMFPVYGLAEAGLAVTFPPINEQLISINISRESISIGNKIKYCSQGEEKISFVDVGQAIDNCEIRICDMNNNVLMDNTVGMIHIKGENITKGYLNDDEKNNKVFTKDGWLITGDTGVIRNNRLVVIGRYKDVIFQNGQNIYLHDIERVATEVDGVDKNKVVACGIFNAKTQQYNVVLFVLYRQRLEKFIKLAGSIKEHLIKKLDIEIKAIVPVRKIYKTTSGKIQRYKFMEKYTNREYQEIVDKVNDLKRKNFSSDPKYQVENIEERLLNICNMVLENKIKPEDNFMELGVSSMVFFRIQALLESEFPCKITISDMYIYSSIRKLSIYIKKYYELNYNNKKDSIVTENGVEGIIDEMSNGSITLESAINKIKSI